MLFRRWLGLLPIGLVSLVLLIVVTGVASATPLGPSEAVPQNYSNAPLPPSGADAADLVLRKKTPTPAATRTATLASTKTPTITPTRTPTSISTQTATNTPTRTATFTPTSAPTKTPVSTATSTPMPTATKAPGIAIGVYEPQTDLSGTAIDQYTSQVGAKPAFSWQAITWQHLDGTYWTFNPTMLDEYRTRGIMPGLTWEPSQGPIESYSSIQAAVNQPEFSWQSIISGTHDAYITQFAQAAAAYQYPFVLRVLHEMNGTWYPWAYRVNGNTNLADFVSAYKHIVNIFRAAGATNVQFVWNPYMMNANQISQYGYMLKNAYPGDSYVNWVALDGYNNSVTNWRTLYDIFQPSYQYITGFTSRPMMLFEVASLENPNDPMARANWITQGFLTTIPTYFPNIKVAAWFNRDNGSGLDYSLDTTNALNAWKQVVASPLYQRSVQ